MRLRVILVSILLAQQDALAFKRIGPWSDTLTTERETGAKVNGAAASGFLRPEGTGKAVPEAEMQPNATCTVEARLQEMEEKLSRCHTNLAFMQFITIVVAVFWPLWILHQFVQYLVPYLVGRSM
jgi:hypothetical protein